MPWADQDDVTSANLNWRTGQFLSVLDPVYSADSSGVASSGASINQALSDASGFRGAVFVPAGSYSLETSLRIPSGVALEISSRATLIRNFAGGASVNATIRNETQTAGGSSNDTDITLRGGTLVTTDGANTGKHLGFRGVNGLQVQGTRFAGVYGDWNTIFENCSNVVVSDIVMSSGTGANTDGIHIYNGGKNITVSNSVLSCGDDCISIERLSDEGGAISDVVINNCAVFSRNAHAIRIRSANTNTSAIERISIANIAGQAGTSATGQAIHITERGSGSVNDITLSNVLLDHSAGAGSAVTIANVRRVTLENVTILSPQGRGFDIDGFEDIKLLNCSSISNRGSAVQGMLLSNGTFAVIRGCSVQSSTQHGILLGATSRITRAIVENCVVYDCTNNGIRLDTADNCIIRGNISTGNAQGIGLTSNANSNIVVDNQLEGNSNVAIANQSGESTYHHNNIGDSGLLVAGPPAAGDASGATGQLTFEAGSGTTYIYICGSANSWFRVAADPF